MWRVPRPHLVHFLSDEGVVPEGFEEGEWLVDGVGNVQLCVYEVLEQRLFQGVGHSEHPRERGRLRGQRQRLPGTWGVALAAMGT